MVISSGETNTPWIVQLKPVRILSRRSDQEYRPGMPWHVFIESSERMSQIVVVSVAHNKSEHISLLPQLKANIVNVLKSDPPVPLAF